MQCVICKQSDTEQGFVTVPLQRGEHTVIFKNVHADVCPNCGEYYLDEITSQDLLERAKQAAGRGVEIEVIRLAA